MVSAGLDALHRGIGEQSVRTEKRYNCESIGSLLGSVDFFSLLTTTFSDDCRELPRGYSPSSQEAGRLWPERFYARLGRDDVRTKRTLEKMDSST
jgi:hypothetical protein